MEYGTRGESPIDDDSLYNSCIEVVTGFIDSLCKYDIRNILINWFKYPFDRRDAKEDPSIPVKNLKELVRVVISSNIAIQFENDDFVIFDTKHANMRTKMDFLCSATKEYILAFLKCPAFFFGAIDQKCLAFYSYSRFRFDEFVKSSRLRKTMVSMLFEDLLRENFLDGRGRDIVMSVIQSEIATVYTKLISETRMTRNITDKYSVQVKNLRFLYDILKDMLKVSTLTRTFPADLCEESDDS